jgi:hypothetical protein
LKTDPRVKSQTQRAADDAISEMMKANRVKKATWKPPKASYKVTKKRRLKVKVSVDVETLKLAGLVIFVVFITCLVGYSFYSNFIYEPKIIIIPD